MDPIEPAVVLQPANCRLIQYEDASTVITERKVRRRGGNVRVYSSGVCYSLRSQLLIDLVEPKRPRSDADSSLDRNPVVVPPGLCVALDDARLLRVSDVPEVAGRAGRVLLAVVIVALAPSLHGKDVLEERVARLDEDQARPGEVGRGVLDDDVGCERGGARSVP